MEDYIKMLTKPSCGLPTKYWLSESLVVQGLLLSIWKTFWNTMLLMKSMRKFEIEQNNEWNFSKNEERKIFNFKKMILWCSKLAHMHSSDIHTIFSFKLFFKIFYRFCFALCFLLKNQLLKYNYAPYLISMTN